MCAIYASRVARLRDELQAVRAEGDAAKLKLARLEGERQSEDARREAERREQERRAAEVTLKQTLGQFGTVRDTAERISTGTRGFNLGGRAREHADRRGGGEARTAGCFAGQQS